MVACQCHGGGGGGRGSWLKRFTERMQGRGRELVAFNINLNGGYLTGINQRSMFIFLYDHLYVQLDVALAFNAFFYRSILPKLFFVMNAFTIAIKFFFFLYFEIDKHFTYFLKLIILVLL